MRKLIDEDYEEIRQMYADGVSKADISKKKGVSKYYVDAIIGGSKGVPRYHTHHENTRKMPAGGLSLEMIAEVRERLNIGDTVIINSQEDGRFEASGKRIKGHVIDKYPVCFLVQVGENPRSLTSFKYVELLMRGNSVRLDRRRLV